MSEQICFWFITTSVVWALVSMVGCFWYNWRKDRLFPFRDFLDKALEYLKLLYFPIQVVSLFLSLIGYRWADYVFMGWTFLTIAICIISQYESKAARMAREQATKRREAATARAILASALPSLPPTARNYELPESGSSLD